MLLAAAEETGDRSSYLRADREWSYYADTAELDKFHEIHFYVLVTFMTKRRRNAHPITYQAAWAVVFRLHLSIASTVLVELDSDSPHHRPYCSFAL